MSEPSPLKSYLASLLRHATTALLGLGGLLFSKGLIEAGDVAAVDAAGASLQSAVIVIVVAVVGRICITLTGKIFPGGPGKQTGPAAGGPLIPVWVGIGAMAALVVSGLPSCSSTYPLTGSILYRDPATGAKGGLVFTPGHAPSASLRMPLYDPRTGQLLGAVDLRSGK